jgi:hypothetical protein
MTGGKRGNNVYEYRPGETITIKVKEFVPHPGYFRIAFDNDGDDGFKEPQSINPVVDPKTKKPHRECLRDGVDQCGESDFNNNDTVLMDNLDPHVANVLSEAKTYTWKVTLPDVECTNCTLQIIQVMEDTIHGGYCPKGECNEGGAYVEDIYHTCIDLVLKADATGENNPTPPATGDDDEGGDGDSGDGDDSGGGDGDDGASGDGDDDSGDDDEQEGDVDGAGGSPKSSDSSCTVGIPGRRADQGVLAALGLFGLAVGSHRLYRRRRKAA